MRPRVGRRNGCWHRAFVVVLFRHKVRHKRPVPARHRVKGRAAARHGRHEAGGGWHKPVPADRHKRFWHDSGTGWHSHRPWLSSKNSPVARLRLWYTGLPEAMP